MVGYSSWSAERIAAVSDPAKLATVPGDFVVVDPGAGEGTTRILTSAIAARPYFCTHAGGALHHGRDVFGVVASARLPWRWNERALQCLALLEHTIEGDSLHADVQRVPPASILSADGGGLRVATAPFWRDVFQAGRSSASEAVDVFRTVVAELLRDGDDPVISMSAGFDSRAILAAALAEGARPTLVSMGFADSTDRVVAAGIAAELDLPFVPVELNPRTYHDHAETIARVTSGTKPAQHWHTYLYPLAAGIGPGQTHLVGSNGEFVRTFYLDVGLAALALDLSSQRLLQLQFALRLERLRRRIPAAIEFVHEGGRLGVVRLAGDLAATAGRGRLLTALDRFYATQRVRNFIGNGLALYAENGAPRSPFLDTRWVAAAATLPRRQKLGSAWHRKLVASTSPGLLGHPTSREKRMHQRPPRLARMRPAPPTRDYSVFGEVVASPETREVLGDSEHLDQFCRREARLAFRGAGDTQSISLLLTLHHAAGLAEQAARRNGADTAASSRVDPLN
jgi:hypothetical protein